jgi:hypothetical protein
MLLSMYDHQLTSMANRVSPRPEPPHMPVSDVLTQYKAWDVQTKWAQATADAKAEPP